MLGKLFKHEFYGMGRLLIPLFILVAIMTPISSFLLRLNLNGLEAAWAQIIGGLFVIVYVMLLIGMNVALSVFIVMRFYKTMVSDEAYLTHTIPVKTSSIIWVKLANSFIWSCRSEERRVGKEC